MDGQSIQLTRRRPCQGTRTAIVQARSLRSL